MGTYIIATLLFLALAYALYKTFSKRGKCCGNCDGCGSGGGCCGGHHHDAIKKNRTEPSLSPFFQNLQTARGLQVLSFCACRMRSLLNRSSRAGTPPWPQSPAR